jgi:hypothetical protein
MATIRKKLGRKAMLTHSFLLLLASLSNYLRFIMRFRPSKAVIKEGNPSLDYLIGALHE